MLALLNVTHFVATSGYAAIFVLSVLQSCCVPTSSELTLGFAGVLAAEGKLSLPGVIVAGAAGELVGAYIAWAIGCYGGRAPATIPATRASLADKATQAQARLAAQRVPRSRPATGRAPNGEAWSNREHLA